MTRSRTLAAATATALLLAGCSATAESAAPEPVRAPSTDPAPAAVVDTGGMQLPMQVEGTSIVDPGWDAAPQELDGVLFGYGERAGVAVFTAVDPDGTVLWSAERPADRTGHAVTTTSDGRSLAVLTDDATSDDAPTTATAYDLHTGDEVWGPVDVPGPWHGPGLVFAAAPDDAEGTGPRVALDPDTGDVAVSADEQDGTAVIGEYRGAVLVAGTDALVAQDAHDGDQVWQLDLAQHGWEAGSVGPAPEARSDPGTAVLSTAEAEVVVALDDGSVVADEVADSAVDPTTRTRVSIEDDGIVGYDPAGEELWALSVAPGTTVEGIGGALVFLRDGDTIRAHNVVTGDVAEAYDPEGSGDIVVPTLITPEGAVVLSDYSHYYLATVRPVG